MPTESSSAAWHEALAEHDAAAHAQMVTLADSTEVADLHRRLQVLSAELHVLRAAVDRRNRLLQEQTLAIAERDARLSLLEGNGGALRAVGRLVRQVLRHPRKALARLVRAPRPR